MVRIGLLFSNEYSKFNLNKHLYEVEETSSEIYLNLIKSERLVQRYRTIIVNTQFLIQY